MSSFTSSFSQPYVCKDCGNDAGFRSRPRTMIERYILPVLLMQPVRCGHCFRREYRMIFTAVRDRLAEVPAKPVDPVVTRERHVA